MATKSPKPQTVDDYLAAVPADQRAALQKLRNTIRAAVPDAEEYINYGIPAFRHEGKMLAGFGASTKHCSFFPGSGNTVADHKADLKNYDTSKGTIRFQPDKPLPAALVRKLIKARLTENARKQARR